MTCRRTVNINKEDELPNPLIYCVGTYNINGKHTQYVKISNCIVYSTMYAFM